MNFGYGYDGFSMKLSPVRRFQKGFTLIELLVVIGILGILAAALVATIDPFEQLKKADDAKIKNIAVEYQTSLVRYYTTHGAFPWNDANNTNGVCTGIGGADIAGDLGAVGLLSCTNINLIGEGELKSSFTSNLTDLGKVRLIWASAAPTDITVCFSPTSKSQKAAPDTKWTNLAADADPATCPKATAADGDCWWCTK